MKNTSSAELVGRASGRAALRSRVRRRARKASGAPVGDCALCTPATRHAPNRIADRLGVDGETLHRALHAMPMERATAIRRVDQVCVGLERELGGRDVLRKWAHTPIMAFGNKKPVDVLVEGRVEPLERLQAVLEAGVYS